MMFLDVQDLDEFFSLFLQEVERLPLNRRRDCKNTLTEYINFFNAIPPTYYKLEYRRKFEVTVYTERPFYTIRWCEKTLNDLATSNPQHKTRIKVEKCKELVDADILQNPKQLQFIPSKGAIIIGDTSTIFPTCPLTILDGNHRFAKAVYDKAEYIEAYFLHPCIHTEAISNEYIKALYKTHSNCLLTLMYYSGVMKADEVKKGILFLDGLSDPLSSSLQKIGSDKRLSTILRNFFSRPRH
ncbi:MAG: hypothetical protein FWD97_00500 [Defluviitaleaceae bacterium]|nr:hypothetical protein [Defluviitaleaceae bacterium]